MQGLLRAAHRVADAADLVLGLVVQRVGQIALAERHDGRFRFAQGHHDGTHGVQVQADAHHNAHRHQHAQNDHVAGGAALQAGHQSGGISVQLVDQALAGGHRLVQLGRALVLDQLADTGGVAGLKRGGDVAKGGLPVLHGLHILAGQTVAAGVQALNGLQVRVEGGHGRLDLIHGGRIVAEQGHIPQLAGDGVDVHLALQNGLGDGDLFVENAVKLAAGGKDGADGHNDHHQRQQQGDSHRQKNFGGNTLVLHKYFLLIFSECVCPAKGPVRSYEPVGIRGKSRPHIAVASLLHVAANGTVHQSDDPAPHEIDELFCVGGHDDGNAVAVQLGQK